MGALALIASALYWPGVLSPAAVLRWALIAAVVPLLLREQRVTAAHATGAVLVLWAIVSIFWTPQWLDSVQALFVVLMLGACFCLGNQLASLRLVYIGAGIGLSFSSAIAVIQYFGFAPLPTGTGTPISGLFVNGNFMAEAAALVMVAAVSLRLWWLAVLLLPALVLPLCGGALAGCLGALIIAFRKSKVMWLMVGLALAAASYYAAVKGFGTLNDRLVMWRGALNGVTVFGHGIGSFWSTYPQFDLRLAPDLPEFAHNEFINVAFELGLVGVVIFVGFCATLAGPLDTARLVLIALLVESCFAFPLHEPTTAFLGMVVAGHAVRNRYLLRSVVMRGRTVGGYSMERK